MQRRLSTAAILFVGLAASACRAKVLDLGNTIGDAGSSAQSILAGVPRCTTPPLAAAHSSPPAAAPLLGSWTGYVEAYTFGSGSNVVGVTFGAAPDGTLAGTITFDGGEVPPPSTSASDPLPSGPDGGSIVGQFPYGRFAYTAADVTFDGTRLTFHIATNEPWKPWCELQTSYRWPAAPAQGLCGCLPNWEAMINNDDGKCFLDDPATGEAVPVVCNVYQACNADLVCSCWSTGCTVDTATGESSVDVRLTPGHLDGSITGTIAPIGLHLTQVP
ncbi:MAG TPA: hypothetical protein VKU41_31630 [Polyangiaceae bacterium]|nr:hypothetical protein [Polyangiaceae bacterium]